MPAEQHDQDRENLHFLRVRDACKHSLYAVGAFSGAANLLMLVPAFFMLNVYDKAVGNNSLSTLWMLSLITGFLFVILGSMEAFRSRVLVAVSSRVDQLLAPILYRLTFDNAVYVGSDRASIQALADLNGLRQFITSNGIFAFFDAPWLPIYIAILFMFHPLLGWMGVVAALSFFALAVANQAATNDALAKANEVQRTSTADTQKNLRNAEATAAMGMLPELQRRWRTSQDQMLQQQELASNKSGLYNAVIKTMRLAVQSAAIGAGAFLVLKQEISPGMLIAGSILIARALQPVEIIIGAWRGFVDAKEQYSRIDQLLKKELPHKHQLELPAIVGEISASSVAIAPPGSKQPTITGVTFALPPGKTCIVFGSTGAGKSTLIRGILGLWPTLLGEMRIDGLESFKYDRSELGPQIGYLPQSIELLDGSVSDNISRFTEYDPRDVVQAAKDAGVHEFILSLQNGYDTHLGGQYGRLSPGQRQRVALARALYKRPKLVVLDEPNSNLDDEGDAALKIAIDRLKKSGSTVLIVSHRQNILDMADYLLIMKQGQLLDFGVTAEVFQRITSNIPQADNVAVQANKDKVLPASKRTVTLPSR